ncbi:MAG: GGDEF domain-containing protein [Mycobacterium sp.]
MPWLSWRWWWQPRHGQQQANHYDWLSGYLYARGMSTGARIMLSVIAGSMAVSLITLLASADGPRGLVPTTMIWVAFAGGVGCALLWMTRWPTKSQSLAFGLTSNACVALGCLAHPNPLASLIGCIAFATTGAYLAFFHSMRLVLYNFAVAAVVGVIGATRLAQQGHLGLAVVDLWLVLQVNIALPLAIRALVNALSIDLLHSDRDPLTGLFNRRAFEHKTLGLLVARDTADSYLTVVVIDLDDFKTLNDTLGHQAGDRALVRVAQALRASVTEEAVIARCGGEEFLIAQVSADADPSRLAIRVRDAVAAPPAKVTASVGTATAPLDQGHQSHHALIEQLTSDADEAMYIAKRSGGNRVHHHGAPDAVC